MTERGDIDAELSPAEERLAGQLEDQRPVPAAGFRGRLARRLSARDPGYGPRPEKLWDSVALYSAGGVVLLAIGALVATGGL